MRGNFVQQRSLTSKQELRTQLELLLTEGIEPGLGGEPSASQLTKASRLVDRIMAAVDRYMLERGVL